MSELYSPTPTAERRVKVTHLVFGLLFLGLAGIWALVAADLITAERLTILGPGVLIAAGVIGLVASLANGRNRRGAGTAPDPDTTRVTDTDDTEEIR